MERMAVPPSQVSFFPRPLPDELLDSVVYRFHILSGNNHPRDTVRSLYGRSLNDDFPKLLTDNIKSLHQRIPAGMFKSCDELIDKLTLVPAFSALFGEMKMKNLRRVSHENQRFGMCPDYRINTRIIHSELHCCPMCVRENTENFGIPYWHRSHQIDGAVVCHIHGCDLMSACPHCKRPIRSLPLELPATSCPGCNKPLLAIFRHQEPVKELAKLASAALLRGEQLFDHNWLGAEVIARVNGDTETFCQAARNRYGDRYFAANKNIDHCSAGDWLEKSYRLLERRGAWGRWTLNVSAYTHLLAIAHSLFGSWDAIVTAHRAAA